MVVDLTKMKVRESGNVVSLQGGRQLALRLQNLGIRPGKKITKLSAHFWRGPITVQVDKRSVALGIGMAGKIMVEVGKR
jgi:ferrous iron transport protein A